jgi:hypothetical protein
LELLDSSKYDIFLAGETHATKIDYVMELAMLEFLNKSAGVKYILLETGYASSAYLNLYLQNGDIDLLNNYMQNLRGTFSNCCEHYDFWQKVYKYNQTLSEENRLSAVGVDIEHQWNTVVLYLQKLIKDKQAPDEIKATIEKLTAFTSLINRDLLTELLTTLETDLYKNEAAYQEFLKEDFFAFEFSIKNCIAGIDSYEDMTTFGEKREKYISDNFKVLYTHYNDGKFFGQWGAEHIYQTACDTEYLTSADNRFAITLEQPDSPAAHKVCSILYVYENSKLMNTDASEQPITHKSLTGLAQLSMLCTGNLTFFKLEAEDSPFADTACFLKSPTTDDTLDYFQYILLIKNSEACTPYQ